MLSIELSPDQDEAVDAIIDWYKHKSCTKQVFTLAGYAGTGKSTIATYIRSLIRGLVAYVSFTGKAATVLQQKLEKFRAIKHTDYVGTIHSLIYRYKKTKSGQPYFEKKSELDEDYSLIIADEGSMIGNNIFGDLKSYNVPILLIGDNAQLEPVLDSAHKLLLTPDFQLTKIHRQAEGNPIIRLARDIREGRPISFGQYASNVWLLNSRDADHQVFINTIKQKYDKDDDIILCGYNRTRVTVNDEIRNLLGHNGNTPELDDKVICLRNNKRTGVFNGMIGRIIDINTNGRARRLGSKIGHTIYEASIDFDSNTDYEMQCILGDQFRQEKTLSEIIGNIVTNHNIVLDIFDFGYCISTHKAQGSEFKRVTVYRQTASIWDQRKWDYTAVTRAVEQLYVIY